MDESGRVSYRDVIQEINWRDNPVPPSQRLAINADENWEGTRIKAAVQNINYQALLQDVFGLKD